jgi:hypothetical protein
MIDERIYEQIREIGRDLYVPQYDLVTRRQYQRPPGRPGDHQAPRRACLAASSRTT